MNRINLVGSMIAALVLTIGSAVAQRNTSAADNAALRYWAAFSQLQDAAITDQEAKELNAVLDSMGPYDDSKYKELLQRNSLALEVMARGSTLSNCDWGLDYGLGEDIPVDYARKALVLGRLNVLNVIHLYHTGNKDGAIRALAAGLRFSRDVANGGSLFATLIAKDLLFTHLTAVGDAIRIGQLSAPQRSLLQNAVRGLGEGLDWPTAARRDLEALRPRYATDPQTLAALIRMISAYEAVLNDQSKLATLTEAINNAPQELASVIPNPKQLLEQKRELTDRLQQTRELLSAR
jgi:hypothetical protein